MIQSSGIITILKTAVQAFSLPGDTVLIQPPAYAHFHDDALLNNRSLALAPQESTKDGYRYNAEVFEAAIQHNTKILIMSNPHNPTENVWFENELRSMG